MNPLNLKCWTCGNYIKYLYLKKMAIHFQNPGQNVDINFAGVYNTFISEATPCRLKSRSLWIKTTHIQYKWVKTPLMSPGALPKFSNCTSILKHSLKPFNLARKRKKNKEEARKNCYIIPLFEQNALLPNCMLM